MRIERDMSSTLLKLLFSSIIFCSSIIVQGQIKQVNGFETILSKSDDSYSITSASEDGVVLHRLFVSKKYNEVEIVFLDSTLTEQWKGFITINSPYYLSNKAYYNGHFFLTFIKLKSLDHNILLIDVDLKSKNYKEYTVRNSISFNPSIFRVTSRAALFGGYYGQVPIVLFYGFTNQQSKILPGLLNEVGELNQLNINTDESFDLLISGKSYQKQKTIWVKNYSPEGSLIGNNALETNGQFHLLFGNISRTISLNPIIAGVYGNRNSEYSRGVFVATNEIKNQSINYYNFSDLSNFFKYLPSKKENRIKERIQRKKIKGKKIRLQYRFLLHELVPFNNYYVLLGEAFYPKYKKIDSGQGISGYLSGNNNVFDGYQYTHAVVLGIDKNGKLLWDNSFEINDIKTFTLDQYVKMHLTKDQISLIYLFDNKIRTKIIKENTVIEGKTTIEFINKVGELDQSNPGEEINRLEYWYKDFFLTYGTKGVLRHTRSGAKRSEAFFVNKITFN